MDVAVRARTTEWMRPYLFGGLAGLLLVASVGVTGEFFGTSTTFPRAVSWLSGAIGIDLSGLELFQVRDGTFGGAAFPNWQLLFVIGIGIGSFLASWATRTFKTEKLPPMWEERFGSSMGKRIGFSLVGGIFAMVGARMAGGCPSGHGVSGVSQLGVSSVIALACFFIGGIAITSVLYRGGAR